MSASNGRPQPEVIMNYADGFSYSKHKMEEAFRAGGFLEKVVPKVAKETTSLKREDVDLIMHEFEISRVQAEKVLADNGADVVKALNALVAPPSNNS